MLLFVLLSLPAGGAVGHYCFDGLEPPVTVHFDSFSGHEEHDQDSGHTDVEKELLADNLLSKVFEFDSQQIISVALSFSVLPQSRVQNSWNEEVQTSNQHFSLLPPPRAPPLNS